MATHSTLLPGKSHGWRILVGYSPWGHKASDTTERLHLLTLYQLSYQGSPIKIVSKYNLCYHYSYMKSNGMKNHCCYSATRTLMANIWNSHLLIKIINNTFIDLPGPTNISLGWNFGSLLGICLVLQILTGLSLAMHYTLGTITAFSSVTRICQDVNYGWIICYMHANRAFISFVYLSM